VPQVELVRLWMPHCVALCATVRFFPPVAPFLFPGHNKTLLLVTTSLLQIYTMVMPTPTLLPYHLSLGECEVRTTVGTQDNPTYTEGITHRRCTIYDHEGLANAKLRHPLYMIFHKICVSPEDKAHSATRFYRWHTGAIFYGLLSL
jgi:hypothetical protein